MSPVLFAHANGYPPGAYRCLLMALESGLGGSIATHEHMPLVTNEPAPRFLSWQTYASDLIERIERDAKGPIWLMGHSMGAASGVLAAARRPELFLGIIALDPVIIPDNIWFWSLIFNRLRPSGMPIIRRAMGRPHQFANHEQAFDFYRAKRVFSSVRDEVLDLLQRLAADKVLIVVTHEPDLFAGWTCERRMLQAGQLRVLSP